MENVVTEAFDNQILNEEEIERWPAEKVLFYEGEEPRGIYIVHSGEVAMVFSGRNGLSKTLRLARAGEAVGLSDAISNSPHDCTATTRTPARIGFVSLPEFRRALSETPSLWFTVLQFLSEDVSSCWASMRSMAAR